MEAARRASRVKRSRYWGSPARGRQFPLHRYGVPPGFLGRIYSWHDQASYLLFQFPLLPAIFLGSQQVVQVNLLLGGLEAQGYLDNLLTPSGGLVSDPSHSGNRHRQVLSS